VFPQPNLGVPPCGRAYFLLLRQKKVAKEKATPRSVPGVAGFPALLDLRGGCATRTTPSNSARPFSAPACVARHLSRGPQNLPYANSQPHFGPFSLVDRSTQKSALTSAPRRLSGPLVKRRATQMLADQGRGLSEARRAEFRSPRQDRVAQGSRHSRPRSQGSPFLCLLSFGEAKESKTPRKGGTQRQSSTTKNLNETNPQ